MNLQAVIFDLDGVITDTSEYHYLAWQRLADEEGWHFDRQINERLRGVSRRPSLEIILAENGVAVKETRLTELLARKNSYYVAMLDQITPQNLLPGALPLIRELREAGLKVALGSASKNAGTVLARLGIADLMDVIADGYSVSRGKPAPDLFLWAAQQLGLPAGVCAVMEDAEAGIDAALAAGMWAIGIGPAQRVGHAHARFADLDGVTLGDVRRALEDAAWTVAEHAFEAARQHHQETLFTIGNGYLCTRGALEEGYPGEMAASFVHRVWDDMPINFTELANIPRWWRVGLWIDDRPFRLDHGQVLAYRRSLDLRTGVLARVVRWQAGPDRPVVECCFERFASLANPHLAVVRLELRMVEGEANVRVRMGLDGHVENPLHGDRPDEGVGLVHWSIAGQGQSPDEAWLQVRTRSSGTNLALATCINTSGTVPWTTGQCDAPGQPAVERQARLPEGAALVLEKYVAVASSHEAPDPLALAQRTAQAARAHGYQAAREASARRWAEAWECSDVVVEGDSEAQLALRFNIFQLMIAAPRWTEHASIGAKTLSGYGYRHHVFWDTEIFMLPLFTFTQPQLARNMLMYRWHCLPGARAKAAGNGVEGAQFPWESAAEGVEVTPTWVPHFADRNRLIRIWTGDIEIHITADIAYAIMQFWRLTGDNEWMRDFGAEIVLEGAKFFASAAQLDERDGKYHFRNVIGPDEYHDRIDDNAFTNAMARWHLETALDVLAWLRHEHPAKAGELSAVLDLNAARLAHWVDVIGCLYLPEDPETGLIEQFYGYFELVEPDFAQLRDPARRRSMQALLGIEGCAQTQIIKQPDVLMLQYLLPERFTAEQVRINYDLYDPRTDHEHGSSLGPAVSAIMACRVGEPDAAYQHFLRAARADLRDVRGNAGEGIHGASAGGLWQAAVLGFGGLRVTDEGWQIEPRLPANWSRLAFKFFYRGKLESVDIRT